MYPLSLVLFDILLLASILVLAWTALTSPDDRRSVILFMAFGLVVALSWGRLLAPDVALADWLWAETAAGRQMLALRKLCLASEVPAIKHLGQMSLLPNHQRDKVG